MITEEREPCIAYIGVFSGQNVWNAQKGIAGYLGSKTFRKGRSISLVPWYDRKGGP